MTAPTPQYLGGPCDGRLVATDAPDAQTLHPVLTMGNQTVALVHAYTYESGSDGDYHFAGIAEPQPETQADWV